MAGVTDDAYGRAGVDTSRADASVAAIVDVLTAIDPGRPRRALLGSGHYANVVALDDRTGIAVATDGVGTKVIVAEELGRFGTIGIDCVAMNVNDLVCVGATPLALVDYIAVEEADPSMLRAVAEGLRAGAERAGVEIPGGELAQLPEVIRGHPSPRGLDLVASCFGTVALDRVVTGERIAPGDAVVGVPSSGIHSNGLTLARRALPDLAETPSELSGRTVGEELLEPTAIYVRAALELLASEIDVRGLAHITGGGLLNLLRLGDGVGYRVDRPLPRQPIFDLIAARAGASEAELLEVFNLGCGFACVVAAEDAEVAVSILGERHPGAAVIGEVTDATGVVEVPGSDLSGRAGAGFAERRTG
jgi:phosphoribosylformylglycinamidine cyclo-ligase